LDKKRRTFLKTGLAGIAGAAVLPACGPGNKSAKWDGTTPADQPTPVASEEPKPGEKKPEAAKKIVTRTLGKTGLELPVLSIGAMAASDPNLLRTAIKGGVKHIDTAHVYQGGKNEEMVGEAVKDLKREDLIIATKVRPDVEDRRTGLFTKETKPEQLIEKFEISLKRLKMDYVDILYLHSVVKREAVLYEPIMEVMSKLKQQGKARFIGVSTHRNEPEVLRAAADSKVWEVVLTAYNFRQPHIKEMDDALAYATKAGIGTVAMKTQAGVFYDKARTKPINMQAALKWALRNPNMHTAIPGITTFEELETDLPVIHDVELTPEEERELLQETKTAGLYCSQCSSCTDQCKEHLDIPTFMRSYMYAYGYQNPRIARDAIDSLALADMPCASCGACTVKSCPMWFDVRGRLADIARIRDVPVEFLG